MTATEELRRMLDERGVEWWKASPCKTKWHSPVLGGPVAVREWNGKMVLDAGYVNVTPEQAIAATLDCIENKSRWHKLFGTPERAARTIATQCFGATSEACDMCVFDECDGKLRNSGTYQTVYDALLEWLRGNA
jgi:hypothetical protein